MRILAHYEKLQGKFTRILKNCESEKPVFGLGLNGQFKSAFMNISKALS